MRILRVPLSSLTRVKYTRGESRTIACNEPGCHREFHASEDAARRAGWWFFRFTDGFGKCPEHGVTESVLGGPVVRSIVGL